ncbi:hypothetical protein HK100_002962 [Physocladia obscura]|uniref:Uncharacterized protein n=1 Tax=Physocladia obscura TaxID=109957 RepID=A0AAD5SV12_9FUNG|nr:hypothetical protein HK100_002962 [Physocladia obscura]
MMTLPPISPSATDYNQHHHLYETQGQKINLETFEHRHFIPLHPTCNKLLAKRWEGHARDLHLRKLNEAKPTIDDSKPRQYRHLDMRLKKHQMEEERVHEIEKNNNILFRRIMTQKINHTDISDISTIKAFKENRDSIASCHEHFRKRGIERILKENLTILQRIEEKAPNYNRLAWHSNRYQNLGYLCNISQYPKHYFDLLEEGKSEYNLVRPRTYNGTRKLVTAAGTSQQQRKKSKIQTAPERLECGTSNRPKTRGVPMSSPLQAAFEDIEDGGGIVSDYPQLKPIELSNAENFHSARVPPTTQAVSSSVMSSKINLVKTPSKTSLKNISAQKSIFANTPRKNSLTIEEKKRGSHRSTVGNSREKLTLDGRSSSIVIVPIVDNREIKMLEDQESAKAAIILSDDFADLGIVDYSSGTSGGGSLEAANEGKASRPSSGWSEFGEASPEESNSALLDDNDGGFSDTMQMQNDQYANDYNEETANTEAFNINSNVSEKEIDAENRNSSISQDNYDHDIETDENDENIEKSHTVGSITEVIDQVADNTNLYDLNSAINEENSENFQKIQMIDIKNEVNDYISADSNDLGKEINSETVGEMSTNDVTNEIFGKTSDEIDVYNSLGTADEETEENSENMKIDGDKESNFVNETHFLPELDNNTLSADNNIDSHDSFETEKIQQLEDIGKIQHEEVSLESHFEKPVNEVNEKYNIESLEPANAEIISHNFEKPLNETNEDYGIESLEPVPAQKFELIYQQSFPKTKDTELKYEGNLEQSLNEPLNEDAIGAAVADSDDYDFFVSLEGVNKSEGNGNEIHSTLPIDNITTDENLEKLEKSMRDNEAFFESVETASSTKLSEQVNENAQPERNTELDKMEGLADTDFEIEENKFLENGISQEHVLTDIQTQEKAPILEISESQTQELTEKPQFNDETEKHNDDPQFKKSSPLPPIESTTSRHPTTPTYTPPISRPISAKILGPIPPTTTTPPRFLGSKTPSRPVSTRASNSAGAALPALVKTLSAPSSRPLSGIKPLLVSNHAKNFEERQGGNGDDVSELQLGDDSGMNTSVDENYKVNSKRASVPNLPRTSKHGSASGWNSGAGGSGSGSKSNLNYISSSPSSSKRGTPKISRSAKSGLVASESFSRLGKSGTSLAELVPLK